MKRWQALVGVGCLCVAVGVTAAEQSDRDAVVEKIHRWAEECQKLTKKKKTCPIGGLYALIEELQDVAIAEGQEVAAQNGQAAQDDRGEFGEELRKQMDALRKQILAAHKQRWDEAMESAEERAQEIVDRAEGKGKTSETANGESE